MTVYDSNRRTFLKASGATLTIALAAGCLGGDSDGGSDGDDGSDADGADGNDGGDGVDFGGWLDDANGDTSVADHTGEDEVTVDVGAGNDGFAFDPAAIRIDVGTTVVWEWTGEGGSHDVVDTGGAFESDLLGDDGATFEHTFDEADSYTYSCTPHEASGMKGAVEVAE